MKKYDVYSDDEMWVAMIDAKNEIEAMAQFNEKMSSLNVKAGRAVEVLKIVHYTPNLKEIVDYIA